MTFLKHFLLDLFFPRSCLGCGFSDTWICDSCWTSVRPLSLQQCYRCRKPSKQGLTCVEHRSALKALLVCAHHDGNPLLKNLLYEVKYRQHPQDIGDKMAQLIHRTLQRQTIDPSQVIAIPVPLHPKRFRQRGFNQADLISQQLPQRQYLLKRSRHTRSQVENHSRQARLENLKDAFVCESMLDPDQTYLLVDDVATTGSTLEECAQTLEKAGARDIRAIVLTRN